MKLILAATFVITVIGEIYENVLKKELKNANIVVEVEAPSQLSCVQRCMRMNVDALFDNGVCKCVTHDASVDKTMSISGMFFKTKKLPRPPCNPEFDKAFAMPGLTKVENISSWKDCSRLCPDNIRCLGWNWFSPANNRNARRCQLVRKNNDDIVKKITNKGVVMGTRDCVALGND